MGEYIHKHLGGMGEGKVESDDVYGYGDDGGDMDGEMSMTGIPPSLDEKLKMSIGYDPRKGRV